MLGATWKRSRLLLSILQPEAVIHTFAMGAADAAAAHEAFAGRTGRLVLLSSGDVYRAYGRFIRLESGAAEQGLLQEDSPLRTVLFPYRRQAPSQDSLQHWYDKILAERAVLGHSGLPATILRLPKVYGPGSNSDLATVYRYRHHPHWRWTHGYVENVAAAIVLAATHPSAAGRVYNVGEQRTPAVGERLCQMPPSTIEPDVESPFDFAHDLAYATSRIRSELGYREIFDEQETLQRTLYAKRA